MTPLPVLSGRELIRALERAGYKFDRQKGSHIVLRHDDPPYRRLTISDHREIKKGALRAMLRHAGRETPQPFGAAASPSSDS